MSVQSAKINKKTLINLMLALLSFFLIINYLVISQQRHLLETENEKFVNNEIGFFAKLTNSALLKKDYASIEQTIDEWGEDNSGITKISLTAKNGFIIAEYNKGTDPEHPETFSHKINYNSGNYAILNVTVAHDAMHSQLASITFNLITASILLVVVFGTILWRILLQTAITPLQKEIKQHEITSRQLLESKKAAESANYAKSEFLANMSHEIRTPMNGVLGMLSLLLDTKLSDKQRDFARTAYNSGDTLLTVLNDILDFSKIEAHKLDIDHIPFSPLELIEENVSLLAGLAQKKDLELLLDMSPDMPAYLTGDASRIRQVLTNLISNAIKFTDKGEVLVYAQTTRLNDQQFQLMVRIKDTGIGISDNKKDTIFNAFEQEDGSTTRLYGGTGLGLSISKKLCTLMNGDLKLESTSNQGSVFSFKIPLTVDEHEIKIISASPEHISKQLKDKRILIIDDNETNRHILENLFENNKINCSSADSAKSALALLAIGHQSNKPFDIIITDMMMPEINGNELTKLIKSDPRNDCIPVILLSSLQLQSNSDPMQVDKNLYEAILTKPIRQSLLIQTLNSITNEIPDSSQETDIGETETEQPPFSGYTAILAEDNVINQRVAAGMLKKLGFDFSVVSNGIELLEALKTSQPDVIYMDCNMPLMDGFEASMAIRQMDDEIKDTIIIAMTANAMQEDKNKCINAGMNDYISKPISCEKIHDTTQQWLNPVNAAITDSETSQIDAKEQAKPDIDIDHLLDMNKVNSLKSIISDNYSNIVADFFSTAKETLSRIHNTPSDSLNLLQEIHTLKGSSANIGASQLSFSFMQFERSLKNNLDTDINTYLEEINHIVDKTEIAFKQIL